MPRTARSQTSTTPGPSLVPRTPTATAAAATTRPPAHETIAARAYELFEQDGWAHGHDLDHWLEAERQLALAQAAASTARRGGGTSSS